MSTYYSVTSYEEDLSDAPHDADDVVEFLSDVEDSYGENCDENWPVRDIKQERSPVSHRDSSDQRTVYNSSRPELAMLYRTRPEIAHLITPLIYSELINEEDVVRYEPIRGVANNLFFVTHENYEQVSADFKTRKNQFEADFMVELARYLILQGYSPSEITILTIYTGQMYFLRDLVKTHGGVLSDVKCITVDEYQGEENAIVLLSLVRSNADKELGLLSVPSRVCVALSRARQGLFIIGNMDMLAEKTPQLWAIVRNTLQEQNAIGPKLELICQRHGKSTFVSNKNDFAAVREGGCDVLCNDMKDCQHVCRSLCHILDREHKQSVCNELCMLKCKRGRHPCKLLCYEECKPCQTLIKLELPCHHIGKFPCSVNEDEYACTAPCPNRLPCGHACTSTCHVTNDPDHVDYKCTKRCGKMNKDCKKEHRCEKLCFEECVQCNVQVWIALPGCNHEIRLICSTDLSKIKCLAKCGKICPNCQTKCGKQCYEDCNSCSSKIRQLIPECGHSVVIECGTKPTRSLCVEKCNKVRNCGHECRANCCTPCDEVHCLELVNCEGRKPLCEHDRLLVPCFVNDLMQVSTTSLGSDEENNFDLEEFLPNCDEPCGVELKCGHLCSGTCGKCWQGRLHFTCQEDCKNVFICGHSCKKPCGENCPPCDELCNYECRHSKCPNKCGVPCVKCCEPCDWRCEHKKCYRLCHEICDRDPCYETCKKKLACGHYCIGFCGEKCPPKCRICDFDEVTAVFFGTEDEEDARFVLLEDCDHIFESTGLEKFLSMANGGEIVKKACPLCKKAIHRTRRFMTPVKKTYNGILAVKAKIYGDETAIKETRSKLAAKLEKLQLDELDNLLSIGLESLDGIVHSYFTLIEKKQNHVSLQQLDAVQYYYGVAREITSRVEDLMLARGDRIEQIKMTRTTIGEPSTNEHAEEAVKKTINFTKLLISRIDKVKLTVLNDQHVNDIYHELRRFHTMVDYCVCLVHPNYKIYRNDAKVVAIRQQVENVLYGICKFSEDDKESVDTLFVDLQNEMKSVKPLTKEEKRMIHLAMAPSFSKQTGHWFMCSNGHYYCITECGGAMQKSNCPECGEEIGGSNHQTVLTSRLVTDMN